MPSPSSPRRGLVLFPRDPAPRHRRARLAFVALLFAAAAAVATPLYAFFAGIRPLIFGLPLSFAWVVFWLLAVFAGLLALYRSEPHQQPREEAPPDETREVSG